MGGRRGRGRISRRGGLWTFSRKKFERLSLCTIFKIETIRTATIFKFFKKLALVKHGAVTLHPWTMRPWTIRPWKNWMKRSWDYASLGLCVPGTFCPWPFCDNTVCPHFSGRTIHPHSNSNSNRGLRKVFFLIPFLCLLLTRYNCFGVWGGAISGFSISCN
jgi:hypothetical protein